MFRPQVDGLQSTLSERERVKREVEDCLAWRRADKQLQDIRREMDQMDRAAAQVG